MCRNPRRWRKRAPSYSAGCTAFGGARSSCWARPHQPDPRISCPSFGATCRSSSCSDASPRLPRSLPRPARTCRRTCSYCGSSGIRCLWKNNLNLARRETRQCCIGLVIESTYRSLVTWVVYGIEHDDRTSKSYLGFILRTNCSTRNAPGTHERLLHLLHRNPRTTDEIIGGTSQANGTFPAGAS